MLNSNFFLKYTHQYFDLMMIFLETLIFFLIEKKVTYDKF